MVRCERRSTISMDSGACTNSATARSGLQLSPASMRAHLRKRWLSLPLIVHVWRSISAFMASCNSEAWSAEMSVPLPLLYRARR